MIWVYVEGTKITSMIRIHINCDMAESYGNLKSGNDIDIMPFVDAVNIACGFHGGDPLTIFDTITLAHQLNKEIGAHPSYPDLVGFGRRYMEMTPSELYAALVYQIGAVKAMAESIGSKLYHVKPHGALYNAAFSNQNVASVIVDAVKAIDAGLIIYAQEYSLIEKTAQKSGITIMNEGFADRKYNNDGTLTHRQLPGAVISSPEEVKEQAFLLIEGKALTISGKIIKVAVDTICLHGDHPEVVQSLTLIRNQS